MYQRIETTDGKTVMNKALYDNLQDGIDEALEQVSNSLTASDIDDIWDNVTSEEEVTEEETSEEDTEVEDTEPTT